MHLRETGITLALSNISLFSNSIIPRNPAHKIHIRKPASKQYSVHRNENSMNYFFSTRGNDNPPSGSVQPQSKLYVAYLNKEATHVDPNQGEDKAGYKSFFFSSYISENGEYVPAILSHEDELKLFDEYY